MQQFEQLHLLTRGINTRKLVCLAWTRKTYSGVREGALQVQVQVCTTPFSGQKEFNVSQIRDTCNRDLQTATTSEKTATNSINQWKKKNGKENNYSTDRADPSWTTDCLTSDFSVMPLTSWGTCYNGGYTYNGTVTNGPMGNHIQKYRRVQRCTQDYPCCILTRTVTRTLRNF